jgi:hypothetical protein
MEWGEGGNLKASGCFTTVGGAGIATAPVGHELRPT